MTVPCGHPVGECDVPATRFFVSVRARRRAARCSAHVLYTIFDENFGVEVSLEEWIVCEVLES